MRPFPGTTAATVLTILGAFGVWTLPPGATTLAPSSWTPRLLPVSGAYHIHTVLSDGSGTISQVAAAAARVGLSFVIITDHGDGTHILRPAYHSGVLCIDGVEVSTTGGHYVALGLAQTPYPLGGEPRDVVADVMRLGGFGIAAHPDSPKPALHWNAWDLPFDGIEWMNADSERRERTLWQLATSAMHYPIRPAETLVALFQRPIETLSRWDTLIAARRVVALAGADAHARIGWGGTEREGGVTIARLPSYEASLAAFSIHAEIARPLTGGAAQDARTILDAIEAGHVYTALDGLARPALLSFTARTGTHTANEGDDLILDGPLALHARVNDPQARLVLFRDGLVVADRTGGEMSFDAPATSATFRLEARRASPAAPEMPWIVSNPIYVRAAPRLPPSPRQTPPAAETEVLAPALWSTEHSPTSIVAVTPGSTGVRIDFTLGDGVGRGQHAAALRAAPPDMPHFDRLVLQGHASRPMRMSVQLRDLTGRRWSRSVYFGPTAKTFVVPFAEFRPTNDAFPAVPPLTAVRTILFVIDLTNAEPGAFGTLWLNALRLEC